MKSSWRQSGSDLGFWKRNYWLGAIAATCLLVWMVVVNLLRPGPLTVSDPLAVKFSGARMSNAASSPSMDALQTAPSAEVSVPMEGSGSTLALGPVFQAVFRMYTTRSVEEQRELFAGFYSPDVVFEDPLMRVYGKDNYRVQFVSLIKLFDSVTITPWLDTSTDPPSTSVASDSNTPLLSVPQTTRPSNTSNADGPLLFRYRIRTPGTLGQDSLDVDVWNTQLYAWNKDGNWFRRRGWLPSELQLRVITTVTLSKRTGYVLRHQDVWPESSAFQSACYQRYMKDSVGRVTSAWFKFLGW